MSAFNYWRKRVEKLSDRNSTVNSSVPVPSSSLDTRVTHRTKPSLCRSTNLAGHFGGTESPTTCPVQFTLQIGTVGIHCQCASLEAIERLLTWSVRHQASGFQQLQVEG